MLCPFLSVRVSHMCTNLSLLADPDVRMECVLKKMRVSRHITHKKPHEQARTYTHTFTLAYTDTYIKHTHTHTHTHIHTHTYTHTHTHTHTYQLNVRCAGATAHPRPPLYAPRNDATPILKDIFDICDNEHFRNYRDADALKSKRGVKSCETSADLYTLPLFRACVDVPHAHLGAQVFVSISFLAHTSYAMSISFV
jgi:hypothetical protein